MPVFNSYSFSSCFVRSRNTVFLVAMAGLMVIPSGCGGSNGGKFKPATRAVASGAVSLDGKPVTTGTVTFTHKDSGLPSVCPIENGTFKSPSDKGPQIGVNSAILSARGEDGQMLWSTVSSEDVTVAAGKFTKDFALTNKQVKMVVVDKTKKRSPSEKVWPGDE